MTLFTGITPEDFARLASSAGVAAEVRERIEGAAIVSLKVHGFTSLAFLQVPAPGGKFSSVQFWIGWTDGLSAEEANKWNAARRYAFAYSDEDGHANLQLDFSVVGVDETGITHYVGLWAHLIAAFIADMSA